MNRKSANWVNESEKIDESRGGWMINMLGDLQEAFDSDAGFHNGKYHEGAAPAAMMVSQKDHKALIKALKSLSSVMAKAYKGKLIGF